MSNDPEEPNVTGARTTGATQASAPINTQALDETTKKVSLLSSAVNSLNAAIAKVGPGFTSATAGMTKFGQATSNVTGMVGNIGSAMFGSANEKGWVRDFMMFPTRFMSQNIQENRQLALTASGALGPQAFATGATTQSMMRNLSGFMQSAKVPGGVLGGSPGEMLDLMNIMSRVGAGINWGAQGPNVPGQWSGGGGPRAAGFMRGITQAQMMNPGAQVGQLAAQIGQQSGNVGAQQQAAFLTGGAFAMIGAGNKQKSISEWAEGILKWLVNLRPGRERGKMFGYGELMSQNFPGSNIDAWLSANGISEDMKQMFWSYAMAKSRAAAGSMPDDIFAKNEAVNQSVAFQRLQATSAQTRTGFQLAGTMAGTYANKEQANRWMAELMGHMMQEILPAAMSSGMLSYMQYLPDTIEEMIMQLAERTNLGTLGAGVVGWGSQFPDILGHSTGTGDVGDVGDFGQYGATSTAGLHPDMRKRVDAMMAANRNLRVTSGYRDLGKQQSLKRRGVGRVSGRPSAHTRGMAADLGPRSQYPWIAANAKKFGLSSGLGQGEPWHVGMGDVGDPISDAMSGGGALAIPGLLAQGEELFNLGFMDSIKSMFSGLFQGVFSPGGSAEDQIRGISGSISSLMKGMMGIFSHGEIDSSRLQFRDVYSIMVDETNKNKDPGLTVGVDTTGGGGFWNSLVQRIRSGGAAAAAGATASTAIPGAPTGPAGAKSLDAFFREVLTGLSAPVTQSNLNKLGAVTKFEGNGSTFNPFNSTGGDFPNKKNSIGVENYPDWATGVNYTTKLLNQTSGKGNTSFMKANLTSNGSYQDWLNATSNFYQGWGGPRIPNISESSAQSYLATTIKGAGDVADYGSLMMDPVGFSAQPQRAPVVFQNTFNLQGGSGGNGSVDMRRTVQVLADQLEQEMNRRMARSN